MNLKIDVISLPVKDLEAARAFYCDGLGVEGAVDNGVLTLALANDVELFFVERATFNGWLNQDVQAQVGSPVYMTIGFEKPEDVDALLEKAEASGGKIVKPASETEWGYGGYFSDPDGYVWELIVQQ